MTHPTHQFVTDTAMKSRPVPAIGEGVFAFAITADSYKIGDGPGDYKFTMTHTLIRTRVIGYTESTPSERAQFGELVRLEVYPGDLKFLDYIDKQNHERRGYIERHSLGYYHTADEARRRSHYLDLRDRNGGKIVTSVYIIPPNA